MARERPWKWEEFAPEEQKAAAGEINRIGKQTATGAVQAIGKLRSASEKPGSKEEYREKAGKLADRLEGVAPKLKDTPITLRGATSRRKSAWNRAIDYARSSGEALPGSGWYLEHSDAIHEARGDIPFHTAAAASASLSPGKDPKVDELPAFQVLADLHNKDHTITTGGESGPVSNVSPAQLGKYLTVAASENSKGVDSPAVTSSHPDFHIGGRAHERNTVKAIQVLRGEMTGNDANPPTTGPKTASYERSILDAGTASSAERLDYLGIAYHAVHGDPNQGMIQFSQAGPVPVPVSDTSILSGEHDTAEDTWMQAISSGQKLVAKYPGGRTMSPAKRAVDKGASGDMSQFSKRGAGIANDKDKPGTAYVHAFNNKATRQAAAEVGPISFNQHGEAINVPSVMMQEVAWTQARRDAGGDAPFNAQQRQRQEEFTAAAKREAAERLHPQKETLF